MPKMKPAAVATVTPIQAAPPSDPLARFAALAKRARSLADEMGEVADEIEETALAAAEQVQKLGHDTEKLRQLQALLKGLGT